MQLDDYITITPGVRSGKPCIKGTRITVYDVLEYLAGGMSQEQVLAVTVDIPIGLSETGPRECDVEARRLLTSSRGSSVFPAPVRATIDAATYSEACERSEAACGKGA